MCQLGDLILEMSMDLVVEVGHAGGHILCKFVQDAIWQIDFHEASDISLARADGTNGMLLFTTVSSCTSPLGSQV